MKKFLLVISLLVVLPFSLKAQTVTFLNPFRLPITDLEKYPPCYFSIEIDELMRKEIRIYTLDSLLVYEAVLQKDADPYTWIPGKLDGGNVRVRMRLPISFRQ